MPSTVVPFSDAAIDTLPRVTPAAAAAAAAAVAVEWSNVAERNSVVVSICKIKHRGVCMHARGVRCVVCYEN